MKAPRSPRCASRTRGFTLIELLTVIAIIGVLAALLVPVVARVRASARSAQCLSNLRQIGSAIHLYVGENRGFLPYGYDTVDAQWFRAIDPYFGNSRQTGVSSFQANTGSPVLFCETEEVRHDPANALAAKRSNYAANPRALPSNQPSSTGAIKPRVALGSVLRPAQVVLVADGTVKTSDDPASRGNSDYAFFQQTGVDATHIAQADVVVPHMPPSGNGTEIAFRHNHRAQVVFIDGHVAAIALGELRNRHIQPAY